MTELLCNSMKRNITFRYFMSSSLHYCFSTHRTTGLLAICTHQPKALTSNLPCERYKKPIAACSFRGKLILEYNCLHFLSDK